MEEIYCFAGNPLDRMSERRRDREWVQGLLDDPASRILPLYDLKPAIREPHRPVLEWQKVMPWRAAIEGGAMLVFLGIADGRAHFAIDATGAGQPADPAAAETDVRTLAPQLAAAE